MSRDETPLSRRQMIGVSCVSVLALSGCVEIETNPRSGDNTPTTAEPIYDQTSPVDRSTPTENARIATPERECTNAYVSSFDWEQNFDSADAFYATILNQADIAGEIVVQLSFYQSENSAISTGTVERIVSIGAQETRDILIETNPPTSDSSWAEMEVTEQGCVLDI